MAGHAHRRVEAPGADRDHGAGAGLGRVAVRADQELVFTVDNNTAHLHVVVTGEADGGQIRIVNGLAGNETVATSGQNELFDGAPVQATAVQAR